MKEDIIAETVADFSAQLAPDTKLKYQN